MLRGDNTAVFFPPGEYLHNDLIYGKVGVDFIGSGRNCTVLITKDKTKGGIVFSETNVVGTRLEFIVTTISGMSILGGAYADNPFGFKDTATALPGSNGLEVNNLRVKIKGCSIEGWSSHGIITISTYYINVDDCYIANNKVGYQITSTSTSNYLTNSEVRLCGIGVMITGNSFGNFILNNTIESNIANYFDDNNDVLVSKGKGIILSSGATGNYIIHNYIESQIVSIAIDNAHNNVIHDSIITPGVFGSTTFDLVTYYGPGTNNRFSETTIQFYAEDTNVRIRILNGTLNYSSELYSFPENIFNRIIAANLTTLKSIFLGVEGNAPTLRNSVTLATYRALVLRDPNVPLTTDDIAPGINNHFSQFANVTGGVRLNGLIGIGIDPTANLDVLLAPGQRMFMFSDGEGAGLVAGTPDGFNIQMTLYTNLLRLGGKVEYLAAPPDFADDAAAAAGGIRVNGTYRTGNVLKIRLA